MSNLCALHPPGILANVNLKLMEEVRSLRQQGNTPLADTMPNFASESQGKLPHHPSSMIHQPSSIIVIHMCVTVERVWRLISNFVLLICVHAGARVLHSLSSDTYWHRNPHSWRVIDKIYHWYYSPLSQRRVIQVRIHNHKFS